MSNSSYFLSSIRGSLPPNWYATFAPHLPLWLIINYSKPNCFRFGLECLSVCQSVRQSANIKIYVFLVVWRCWFAPWQIDKVRWGTGTISGQWVSGGAAFSCGFDALSSCSYKYPLAIRTPSLFYILLYNFRMWLPKNRWKKRRGPFWLAYINACN